MENRKPRVAIVLAPGWMEFLRWYAAEVQTLPAELAREMVEAALEQARARPGMLSRYEDWRSGRYVEDTLANDVVAAMSVPGVPAVLGGDRLGVTNAAAKAAAFLTDLAAWLADPRPVEDKPPRPRLATTPAVAPFGADVGAALDAAGGADGATVRQARKGGAHGATDKRQLSVMAGAEGGEGAHERDA